MIKGKKRRKGPFYPSSSPSRDRRSPEKAPCSPPITWVLGLSFLMQTRTDSIARVTGQAANVFFSASFQLHQSPAFNSRKLQHSKSDYFPIPGFSCREV